jgi:NAD(P)-dependent dehydrogenase (short-subunit alcohol dehydrogenase family)
MKRISLTGASSGIGRAIAHALLARGDEVWARHAIWNDLPRCRDSIRSTWWQDIDTPEMLAQVEKHLRPRVPRTERILKNS